MAPRMTLKTEREGRLLAASKRFDAGACYFKKFLRFGICDWLC